LETSLKELEGFENQQKDNRCTKRIEGVGRPTKDPTQKKHA
jgi:hypothetical protein